MLLFLSFVQAGSGYPPLTINTAVMKREQMIAKEEIKILESREAKKKKKSSERANADRGDPGVDPALVWEHDTTPS